MNGEESRQRLWPFQFLFFLILKKADPWGLEDLIPLINERFQVPENQMRT